MLALHLLTFVYLCYPQIIHGKKPKCIYKSTSDQIHCYNALPTPEEFNKIFDQNNEASKYAMSLLLNSIHGNVELNFPDGFVWKNKLEGLTELSIYGLNISGVTESFFKNIGSNKVTKLKIHNVESVNGFTWQKKHFKGLEDTLTSVEFMSAGDFEADCFDDLNNLKSLTIKHAPNFFYLSPKFMKKFEPDPITARSKLKELKFDDTGFKGFYTWDPIDHWYVNDALLGGMAIVNSKFACDKRTEAIFKRMKQPKGAYTDIFGKVFCYYPEDVRDKTLVTLSDSRSFELGPNYYTDQELGVEETSSPTSQEQVQSEAVSTVATADVNSEANSEAPSNIEPEGDMALNKASMLAWVLIGAAIIIIIFIVLVFVIFKLKKKGYGPVSNNVNT